MENLMNIKEEFKQEAISIFRDIISEVRDIPELGKQKDQFITSSLENWAGESKVKKLVSSQVAKRMTKNGSATQWAPKTDFLKNRQNKPK